MRQTLTTGPISLQKAGTALFSALCAEPKDSNIEIFKPNHFYGHAHVLKKYANYPLNQPLKAVIQHGYNFLDGNFIFGGEMEADLPVFLPPNPERATLYHQASGGKPAIPIGAPFLYAKKLIDENTAFSNSGAKQGTIVFPVHSTRIINTVFNHQAYAEELNLLPNEFNPISVCIYWRDYHNGSHIPYMEKGFEILTAGHMMEPRFIERVYLNCRPFKYACSNEYGSSLFYAIASGCRFFYLPSEPISYTADDPQKIMIQKASESQLRNFENLFTYPRMAPFSEQEAFALSHLGVNFLKTPQALQSLLRWAEFKDWSYFTPIAKRNKANLPDWFLRIPPRWRRYKGIRKLAGNLNHRSFND